MSDWKRCPVCKEWAFTSTHRCKPEWEVCDADDMEWETVRGSDIEDAAERFCSRRDPWSEYSTVTPSRTVLVQPIDCADLRRRFIVEGELQPVYVARIAPFIDEDGGAA